MLIHTKIHFYLREYFFQKNSGPKFDVPRTTITEDDFESDLLLPSNVVETGGNDEIANIVEAFTENPTTYAVSTEVITEEIETTLATVIEDCNRDGYVMLPYHTIYLFVIILASIFLLLALVMVLIFIVHKRKRLRPRHGEYKLTTMRKLSDKIKNEENNNNNETEEMY